MTVTREKQRETTRPLERRDVERRDVRPIAVSPAPGETEEEAIEAVLDFDAKVTEMIARGDLVLAGDGVTYVPRG